jgi:hypothetical protein
MKTVLTALLVMTAAACSTAAQPPSAGTVAQPPADGKAKAKSADYYPLKVGTRWHYQLDAGNGQKIDLISEIGGVDKIDGKDLARLEVSANGQKLPATEHLQRTADGVFRVRMNNVELVPPICLIKYPVKTGQTWSAETKAGERQVRVASSEGTAEDITVPAGKYRALPCTIVVTDGNARSTTVFWFAEDVGIVKQKSEFGPQTVTTELLKYEAAR